MDINTVPQQGAVTGEPTERRMMMMMMMMMMKCCFTSTETVGLLGTGAQDVHLDFHTAPEL